jgi:hypothetical protein
LPEDDKRVSPPMPEEISSVSMRNRTSWSRWYGQPKDMDD